MYIHTYVPLASCVHLCTCLHICCNYIHNLLLCGIPMHADSYRCTYTTFMPKIQGKVVLQMGCSTVNYSLTGVRTSDVYTYLTCAFITHVYVGLTVLIVGMNFNCFCLTKFNPMLRLWELNGYHQCLHLSKYCKKCTPKI